MEEIVEEVEVKKIKDEKNREIERYVDKNRCIIKKLEDMKTCRSLF